MMTLTIKADPLESPAIAALLQTHLDYAASFTPAESGHALDLEALKQPGISFWSAWLEGELAGCIALKEIDPAHGEIKSMHVLTRFRGQGIGKALVEHLMETARRRGYQRLSLETGANEGFAASRALYESCGFAPCPPFGEYLSDAFSYCMTRTL